MVLAIAGGLIAGAFGGWRAARLRPAAALAGSNDGPGARHRYVHAIPRRTPMYQLTGVTKTYQKGRGTVQALQGVDLEINDGELLAIQGPTGHGKSTLLQMLGGLDRPTSGSIDFAGQDLAQLREGQVTRFRADVDRLHLPDVQPGPDAQRAGERRGRAGARPVSAAPSAAAGRRPC